MKMQSALLSVFLTAASAAHALDISPGSTNFGNLPVGSAASFTFFVTNDSRHWVRLTAITHEHPDQFTTVTNCPTDFAPRTTCSVTVTYAPTHRSIYDHSEVKIHYLEHDGDDEDDVFQAYGRSTY